MAGMIIITIGLNPLGSRNPEPLPPKDENESQQGKGAHKTTKDTEWYSCACRFDPGPGEECP